MKRITSRICLSLFVERAMIEILSLIMVVLVAVIEMPGIDYPTHPFYNNEAIIDPWLDIFPGMIVFPAKLFTILMGISLLISIISFGLSNNQNKIWSTNLYIGTFVDVGFLWVGITWMHMVLICENESLRDTHLYGCFNLELTVMNIILGLIGAIGIILFELVFFRRKFSGLYL
jgi:hypothetical protein